MEADPATTEAAEEAYFESRAEELRAEILAPESDRLSALAAPAERRELQCLVEHGHKGGGRARAWTSRIELTGAP